MQNITRRTALAFGAVSLPALAATSTIAYSQDAASAASVDAGLAGEQILPPSPLWYRTKIGNAVVTVVQDGLRVDDGPYPTFGSDQSESAVHELMRRNLLPETRSAINFSPTLVEINGELVLFDTGFGESERASGLGLLRSRLIEAGYTPEQVSIVVLTHFHRDHISGLMESGSPAFPNARYVVGRREYEWWTSDEARNGDRAAAATLVQQFVVPLLDKIEFVDDQQEFIPGVIAHATFGHSPGHMIFSVRDAGPRFWIIGDMSVHHVISVQRPDWASRFDQNAELSAKMRRETFQMLAEARDPIIGYHMPFPSIGYISQEGGEFAYVPLSYQLEI